MLKIEGVTILSFAPDWMHCKHLGIDKILLGSTLYVLVHDVLKGTVPENLEEVWKDIEAEYKVQNTANRYGRMRQTMFHQTSQPKLQGKAVEVRDLGPVLLKVWEKHMNHNLDIHRKIQVVLSGFSKSQTLNPNLFLVFKVLSTWVVVVGFMLSRFCCERMSLGTVSSNFPLHSTCL
jgi:hypothetical protein